MPYRFARHHNHTALEPRQRPYSRKSRPFGIPDEIRVRFDGVDDCGITQGGLKSAQTRVQTTTTTTTGARVCVCSYVTSDDSHPNLRRCTTPQACIWPSPIGAKRQFASRVRRVSAKCIFPFYRTNKQGPKEAPHRSIDGTFRSTRSLVRPCQTGRGQ